MEVSILGEAGYEFAMLGLSLNKKQPLENMPVVADKLFNQDGGHNKFLESIVVWLDIDAPRYWWSQFDTYRIGVTKQSESTMHTIMKRQLVQEDFEICISHQLLDYLNDCIVNKNFTAVKAHLPESFLQRRIVSTNYKSLRHIFKQRSSHRLIEWKRFCGYLIMNLEHHTYVTK